MPRFTVLLLLTALAVAGCGGDSDGGGGSGGGAPQGRTTNLRADVAKATTSTAADFPATKGRTLQAVANAIGTSGTTLGLATTVHDTPEARIAFGVLDDDQKFVYGPTAVYLAKGPNSKALGPFPAPADSLITDPPFRSQQAATESSPFSAIYETNVPVKKKGSYALLVVTKIDGRLVAATETIDVTDGADDAIPTVGEKAPDVATDTLATVGGDPKLLDTRVPSSDMHKQSLKDVYGKEPVALLFATPQLCQSRVCGPVTDIAYQLEQTYRGKIAFIHQEVYQDNDLQKGLRKPLQEFGLRTEPWLFVLDKTGKITARLEGSFGFQAMETALKTALN